MAPAQTIASMNDGLRSFEPSAPRPPPRSPRGVERLSSLDAQHIARARGLRRFGGLDAHRPVAMDEPMPALLAQPADEPAYEAPHQAAEEQAERHEPHRLAHIGARRLAHRETD